MVKTDKTVAGLLTTIIMAILLVVAWYLGINGMVTTTILTIIGLITGSIFGFSFGIKKGKT